MSNVTGTIRGLEMIRGRKLTTEELLSAAVEAVARLERRVEELERTVRQARDEAASALSATRRNGLR